MTTLFDFFEAVNFRVTNASNYGWSCYGDDALTFDFYEDNQFECSAIVSTKLGEVCELTMHDYKLNRSYRWTNPAFLEMREKEAKSRGVDDSFAYDDVKFCDVEVAEDILEKMTAICKGEDYDTRITIPLDMTDQEFLNVAKAAHALDITINEFFVKAIEEVVAQYK